jgi:hypothetical protein
MDSLSNQYLRDQTGYPFTLDEAFGLLSDWADSEPNLGSGGRDGVSITSVSRAGAEAEEGAVNATKGMREKKKDITCFACKNAGATTAIMTGHYSYEEACPQHANHKPGHNYANDDDGRGKPAAKDGVSNTTVGYALAAEVGGFVIKKDWLLLDNQANIDVFVNGDLLTRHPEGRHLPHHPQHVRNDGHRP